MDTLEIDKYPLSEESFRIIGICMEIHRHLGNGFLEVVYKDALEYELKRQGILFQKEVKYKIAYKDIVLRHFYYADFLVFGGIILEIKALPISLNGFEKQLLNYLTASKCKVGLIINFGCPSLKFKRVVL